uniref:Transposase n=1 Tax=Heterorhabditis bacteriophora TaxID=37862 RepID=A0A1I7WEL3_HETBA
MYYTNNEELNLIQRQATAGLLQKMLNMKIGVFAVDEFCTHLLLRKIKNKRYSYGNDIHSNNS